MKGYSGFEKNKPQSDEYAVAIGKVIVNFGAVELLTYFLIEELSEDPVLNLVAQDMMFAKRIDLIRKLVAAREFDEEFTTEFNTVLDCAVKLGDLRNMVAHNPIVYGSGVNEEGIRNSYSGISLVRKSLGKEKVKVLDIKPIKSGADAVVELGENLDNLLNRVKKM